MMVCCSLLEGRHLHTVGIDQVVSGIVPAVEDAGNPVGELCLRMVLIGWISARRIRIEGLPSI